jgi:hippurate hydrolase
VNVQGLDPELAGRLGGLYQQSHRDPELSLQERQTAARVTAALPSTGVEVTAGVGGTGVVAVLRNGPGPVVMLRADMDALPVAEDTGLPYASTKRTVDAAGLTVPVAHACGHDMHTTCLVGAVELLLRARAEWSGTVVAVFQPAEELACGAQAMVNDGLFDRFPRPAIVLSQHVGPLPAGTIGHGQGPLMAGADSVQVTLFGRGGHGSRPEDTVDPVLMAAAIVLRLQGVVAREVASTEQAVVTVGRLQAGTKDNVIPETAELGINMRTYSTLVREQVRAAIERIVRAEAAASNAIRHRTFGAAAAPVRQRGRRHIRRGGWGAHRLLVVGWGGAEGLLGCDQQGPYASGQPPPAVRPGARTDAYDRHAGHDGRRLVLA